MTIDRRALLVGAFAPLVLRNAATRAAEDPPLRIAVGVGPSASAFWTVRDASGAPQGMTVDLGRAIAGRLKRSAQIVAYDNSGEITEAGARDAWDVTFVPIDDARRKVLDFGPAYDSAEASYLVPPNSPLRTIADVDGPGLRVAGVANTATGRAAQASLKTAKVTGYATVDEIMRLLRDGKVDAFALPRDSLESLAKTVPGSRILPGSFYRTIIAVAVPKGHSVLLAQVSAFMDGAARNGVLAAIRAQNKLP